MTAGVAPVGSVLRKWRQRRGLSQLDLACEAEISTRHLSFLETGRSAPSREMLLRLADRLDAPLRERNALLLAAGYAPLYSEKPLSDPALVELRRELAGYPSGGSAPSSAAGRGCEVAVPFRIHTNLGLLSFLSMTTVF